MTVVTGVQTCALPIYMIAAWVHEGEKRFGIEMEFKVMRPETISRARPSMFFYDLLNGHQQVVGNADWVARLPARLSEASKIPPEEGTRLLVNRGMSLLRCLRWSGGEETGESSFCDRIVGKLYLALGDAVLCLNRLYTVSCRERHLRLGEVSLTPPDWERIREWHGEGLAFKFHPASSGRSAVEWKGRLRELQAVWLRTFLWLEGERLGSAFADAQAYGSFKGRLFPEEVALKNILRHLRDRGHPIRLPFSGGEHPRARVWRSLVFLMAGQEFGAQAQLGITATAATLEEHCRLVWKQYS